MNEEELKDLLRLLSEAGVKAELCDKPVPVSGCSAICGYLIRYRLNKEIIAPNFMFYVTHSDNYYKWVIENQKAAAQPNISAKLYNEYVVSYPSLSEQQTIVETLDSLKSKVDRLQANFDKISQECDALKQAILRQVFE